MRALTPRSYAVIRARWPHLLISLLVVLLLGLSPTALPLAARLRAASLALEAGRPAAALAEFESALAFAPFLTSVRLSAARAALAAGEPARALQHLAEADRTAAAGSEAACLKAEAQLALGGYDSAFEALQKAEGGCPNGPTFLARLGASYLDLGRPESAAAAFEEWARAEPWNAEAQLQYAMTTVVTQPAEALPQLQTALEVAPSQGPLLRDLLRAIREAEVEAEPAFTLAQVGQTFARHGEWNLAAFAFGRALELEPGYIEAQAYLGLALDRAGRDGLHHLQAAVESAPQAAFPRTLLGIHWRTAGEFERALAEFERAADLDPANPAILAELGATYATLGRIEDAKAAYLQATELEPDSAAFWLLLARFSLDYEVEVKSLGLPAARNAFLLSPSDAETAGALGYGYLLVGELALAQRFLELSRSLEPGRAATHFHLGLLYQTRRDYAQAETSFQTAAALEPQGPYGARALRALESLRP